MCIVSYGGLSMVNVVRETERQLIVVGCWALPSHQNIPVISRLLLGDNLLSAVITCTAVARINVT